MVTVHRYEYDGQIVELAFVTKNISALSRPKKPQHCERDACSVEMKPDVRLASVDESVSQGSVGILVPVSRNTELLVDCQYLASLVNCA